MQFRRATVADAHGIARVHITAWEAAYHGILPDEVLDALSVEARAATWRGWLEAPEPGWFTLVAAVEDGTIAGFCSAAAPSRDDDATERTAEIAATYVDPGRWRSGIGTGLLDAALGELRERGYRDATLWVLADNHPAQRFYARYGFAPDGLEGRHDPTGGQPTLRLRTEF